MKFQFDGHWFLKIIFVVVVAIFVVVTVDCIVAVVVAFIIAGPRNLTLKSGC